MPRETRAERDRRVGVETAGMLGRFVKECHDKARLPETADQRDERRTRLVETFREALMVSHADDWPMETIAEAAHICAQAVYP